MRFPFRAVARLGNRAVMSPLKSAATRFNRHIATGWGFAPGLRGRDAKPEACAWKARCAFACCSSRRVGNVVALQHARLSLSATLQCAKSHNHAKRKMQPLVDR